VLQKRTSCRTELPRTPVSRSGGAAGSTVLPAGLLSKDRSFPRRVHQGQLVGKPLALSNNDRPIFFGFATKAGRSGQSAFQPDAQLRDGLSTFWQRFRADESLWLHGMAEEKQADCDFPPRMVAYDLIPFFQQWATRLVHATLNKGDWVPQLIAAICPDDEYTAWAESVNRSAERARDYKLFKGRLYQRRVGSRLFGIWEKEVQHGWLTAKNRMGKHQSCESCREYDLHQELSPGTLALRIPCRIQPVQKELKRLIQSAVEMTIPQQSDEGNGRDDIRLTRMPVRRLVRRSRRYGAIDSALKQCSEARPRSHEEVFRCMETRSKQLIPNAEPFRSAGGWLAGFQKDPALARVWLSKRWSLLQLPAFMSGPKSNY
jgi:hypothetical protein